MESILSVMQTPRFIVMAAVGTLLAGWFQPRCSEPVKPSSIPVYDTLTVGKARRVPVKLEVVVDPMLTGDWIAIQAAVARTPGLSGEIRFLRFFPSNRPFAATVGLSSEVLSLCKGSGTNWHVVRIAHFNAD